MSFRPLRGRVLIAKSVHDAAKEERLRSGLIIPATAFNPRADKSHRGRVLAMGPPARTKRGVEIQPDFRVGDEVLYVWALAGVEEMRTTSIAALHDGPIAVVAQEEVIGVFE